MSKRLRATVPDEIYEEIEQYVYGKSGKGIADWLPQAVLTVMSKNPLTVQQIARIRQKYGERTVVQSEPVALPLKKKNATAEEAGS